MNSFSKNYFDYIEKYKNLHKYGNQKLTPQETFAGHSLNKWVIKIQQIIKNNQVNSIIDFGCGKGLLYKNPVKINGIKYQNILDFWKISQIQLYDPAVPEFASYPNKKADMIICTDVLEHIPEHDVNRLIDDISKLANKIIFFVISTRPASKFFEDGTNVHICLRTKEEWESVFMNFREKNQNFEYIIYFSD